MKRRLFKVFAAVVLAMCLLMAALWLRSQFAYDYLSRESWDAQGLNQRMISLHLSEGQISFSFGIMHLSNSNTYIGSKGPPRWAHSATGRPLDNRGWVWFEHPLRATFLMAPPASWGWIESWSAGLRLWPAGIALLLALCLIALRRFFIVGKSAKGYCAHCGYDLRATPGRCPECGTAAVDSLA